MSTSHIGTYHGTKEVKQEAHVRKDGRYIVINNYEDYELKTHLILPVEIARAIAKDILSNTEENTE